MTSPPRLQPWALKFIDGIYARIPRPLPPGEMLKDCRLISHRGAHDNRSVFENTLAAFDRIDAAGVWGIEFDIRWTRDLHPVVAHDADLRRLFGQGIKICDLKLAELKTSFALIPTLAEVIARYGKRLHLMVELKKENYADPVYQNRLLRDLFAPLEPAVDFHLISLDPELLKVLEFAPARTLLPIAQLNVGRLSRLSRRENYGGLLGHYLFLTGSILRKHRKRAQQVGTGFVNSERCLFRELNRGVTWIFSDNAIGLQTVCNTGWQER